MESMGTMRDLEQIQERDDAGGSSRLMSLALGGLALACVLFAVGVMVGRESGDTRAATREDALDRLDRLDRATRSTDNAAAMTWPERLTGPANGAPPAAPATTGAPTAAATAGPATILGTAAAGPSLADPNNRPVLLPSPAANAAGLGIRMRDGQIPGALPGAPTDPTATPAQAGSEGAFTVQVSSFRNLPHAQNFAAQLRQRGHRAYVAAPATDPNQNVWHRVRIGPFTGVREANAFRATFEQREHLPTIVIRREANPGPREAAPAPREATPAAPVAPAARD